MSKLHPCQTCGACCASFRVAFHWWQAERESEFSVPKEMTVDLDLEQRAMKGTEQKHHPKCCALKGKIGEYVSCTIYNNRSTTCRNFEASFENGLKNIRCDEARAKHGLRPLTKYDWPMSDILHSTAKHAPPIENG